MLLDAEGLPESARACLVASGQLELATRAAPAVIGTQLRTALTHGPVVPADVRLLRQRGRTSWLRVTLTEGRNREVRRYCQVLGHRVVRLRRIEFGPLRLGDLAPGASRPLMGRDVAALNRLRGGTLLRSSGGVAESSIAQESL